MQDKCFHSNYSSNLNALSTTVLSITVMTMNNQKQLISFTVSDYLWTFLFYPLLQLFFILFQLKNKNNKCLNVIICIFYNTFVEIKTKH